VRAVQAWNAPMTFNQQSRGEMAQKEATLKNFFLNLQARPACTAGLVHRHPTWLMRLCCRDAQRDLATAGLHTRHCCCVRVRSGRHRIAMPGTKL
jgi:hypothetical protein